MQAQHPLPDTLFSAMSPLRRRHSLFASPLLPARGIRGTQRVLRQQAHLLARHADRHEHFLNKVTYCLGVLSFGLFCYLLGSSPQDIPRLYCMFFIFVVPLRWMYYRIKKWHYYLLDFCYYANVIFVSMLLFFPDNSRLFMLCFSFSEGPLAWALIVWRCSLVFSSIDKIISVLIHLLPGTVFFILRWWDSNTLSSEAAENETGPFRTWPVVNSIPTLWMWLFFVPLMVYCIWQALYFLLVEGLRRQRILRDPEIMTSYRELKRKAKRANNIWWHLSGLLGDANRVYMYAILQAAFTITTLAFTVPMFRSYRLHIGFEIFKLAAAVWNGGNFIFEVMPRQAERKLTKEAATLAAPLQGERLCTMPGYVLKGLSSAIDAVENVECSERPRLDQPGDNEELKVCILCRKRSSCEEQKAIRADEHREKDVGKATGSQLLRLMVREWKFVLKGFDCSAKKGLKWRRVIEVARAG